MLRTATMAYALVLILGSLALAQPPVPPTGIALDENSYRVRDLGIIPKPFARMGLLRIPPIQDELKLTNAQKDASAPSRLLEPFQKKREEIRQIDDPAKRAAVMQGLLQEMNAAAIEVLDPSQRERLDQIAFQLQGPEAFLEPDLPRRLGLSDDQMTKIPPLVEQGRAEILKASAVPLPIGLKVEDRVGGLETLQKQIDTPEFRAATERARRAARDAWEANIERIKSVLSDTQKAQYTNLLGPRFDLAKLRTTEPDDARFAAQSIAARSGIFGQRPDPDFNTSVARPAYTDTHPRVLFDEAHHNFHTAVGRYRPFADLIASDGYQVIRNHEKFTRPVLERGDILVIANALGGGMGGPGVAKTAFTDEECEAVRGWVNDGGALLLISDHPPFGSAAAGLAKPFGVEMSQGVVDDSKNRANDRFELVFSRENHLLGDHPITRGRDPSERLNRIMTFTGQSLQGPEGSVSFLTLSATATDDRQPGRAPVSVAGRSQGLALPYGKGRIVVLGEAAQLTAQIFGPEREPFGMNIPGIDNRQMAINIMHWLSGRIESHSD